jgi:uncharacterized phiE125 gp8 family phage protein
VSCRVLSVRALAPATALPVSLDTAKLQLRVDGGDDDVLIGDKLAAAVEVAEKTTRRCIAKRPWEVVLNEFPCSPLKLPRPPLDEALGVTVHYTDELGGAAVADPGLYAVEPGEPALLRLVSGGAWPARLADSLVRLRFTAGYTAETLPKSLQDGILVELATGYAFREDSVIGRLVSAGPRSARSLFLRHRVGA